MTTGERTVGSGNAAGMGQDEWPAGRTAADTYLLFYISYGRDGMKDSIRLKDYDELPLVLDVRHIQGIMGISRTSAYELVHTPGFPAFRSGRLIKVSKKAFFDWMGKGGLQQER